MKLKTLLLEYNDKVATYSNELGAYIKILKPKIKGWSFDVERMSGAWEWYHPKFEDSVFATWGWDGKNQIPIESSDGHDCGTIKLKLTPKDSFKDKLDIKKDVKKYLDTMKKEFPKIEKKLLRY